jgi:uncharacterized protein
MAGRNGFTRRKFVGTLLGSGAAMAGYAVGVEPHLVEYVQRDLPIKHLPAALEGKLMVQLSDIHVGEQVSDDFLRRHFARIAAMKPDIVVVTGDWVTYQSKRQLSQLREILKDFPLGRLGTVGIVGNHDCGKDEGVPSLAKAISGICEDAGIRMIRGGWYDIEGLRFLSVKELWWPEYTAFHLHGWESERPAVALVHNPDAADWDVWGDYQGWILCGHTHGGQCRLPFLPPPTLPVKNRRYVAGEYEVGHGRKLYINRGLGHLIHARFFAPPEVTCFRMTSSSR